MADRADRHALYERAVQEPEADIEFAIEAFETAFERRPHLLREDFCGTAALCRDWVREHPDNRAWGVDLDVEVLTWGREHNIAPLTAEQRQRVVTIEGDVLTTRHAPVDIVMAQNFSYFIFDRRDALLRYFAVALANLAENGILVLDAYGGPESVRRQQEKTKKDGFTYVWDQKDFDPVTRRARCYIHFKFPDGSKLRRAFTYVWRVYTIPEIREALVDAGFASSKVYWEGTDPETGEGDGVYTECESGDADDAWVCYIVGFKR